MKLFISIVLFYSIPMVIFSIKGPKEPKTPKIETIKKKKDNIKANPKNDKIKHYKVTAILKNKKRIKGNIKLKYKWFYIKHRRDGFVYHKKLYFNEIKKIKIIKWKPIFSKKSKKRMYYFVPSKYQITTKENVDFILKKRLKLLDRFSISNKYGLTTLYSYFIDYWNGNEHKGYWSNSGSSEFNYNKKNPNSRTVVILKFNQ